MKSTSFFLAAVALGLTGAVLTTSAQAEPPAAVVDAQDATEVIIKVAVSEDGEALTYTNEAGETVVVGAGTVAFIPMGATNVKFPVDTVITVTVKQFGAKPTVHTYRVTEVVEVDALEPGAVASSDTAFAVFKVDVEPDSFERATAPSFYNLLGAIERGEVVNPVNLGGIEGEAPESGQPEEPTKPTKPTKPKPPVTPATDMN